MNISVVIPAYNEEQYIAACLSSIFNQKNEALHEIIVVDNASTDATAQIAVSYPGVRVVLEQNKGLPYARQRGLEEAVGDIVAYIDADTKVRPGWLQRIEREFSKHPKLVSLSGPCRYYDLPKWKSGLVSMWWKALAMPMYFVTRCMVVGGNFAARRTALIEAGGFDASIAFYGDDTNVARRLKKQGKVKFSPRFNVATSARRLKNEGILKMMCIYGANYASQVTLKKTVTKRHADHR